MGPGKRTQEDLIYAIFVGTFCLKKEFEAFELYFRNLAFNILKIILWVELKLAC
jgi:hypothetical protein